MVLAQPQKRGAKSYYTGSRLAFLEQNREEYVSLRGKSRRQFWHQLYTEWWQRYPWRLPDDEEPPADDPKKMLELSDVGVDDDLKSKVEAKARQVRSVQLNSSDPRLIGIACNSEDRHLVQLPSFRS